MASGFVCTVCFRSLSANAGDCAKCKVGRVPLDAPSTLEELREEGERQLHRRSYASLMAIALVSLVLSIVLQVLIRVGNSGITLAASIGLTALGRLIYGALRPTSAGAVLATRRRRIRRELTMSAGAQAPVDAADPSRAGDPAHMDAPALVRWLGASTSR